MKYERSLEEKIDNHKRLIAIMEALPNEKHKQSSWAEYKDGDPDIHACGTSACALGWAALSGEIPGLSATPVEADQSYWPFVEELGVAVDWETVGEMFFGAETTENVFLRATTPKDVVIKQLQIRLNELETYGE